LRGDLEALQLRSVLTSRRGPYAEESVLSKLSGCETTIERGLYKALHELQRLQAARRADGDATPPVEKDVDVSGVSRDED
jgi:hypothetical protein